MPGQYEQPPRRPDQRRAAANAARQRRKRWPKWLRTLYRYWPPIRFGLICVAFICAVSLSISLITSGIRAKPSDGSSAQSPDKGETSSSTESAEDAQLRQQVDALIRDADFIAAGYDYEKAIQMLQSFSRYEEFPELAEKVSEYQVLDSKLLPYNNMSKITHVFFHSLIVDTSRAFDGEYTEDGYNQYMTTIGEFQKMMQSMYDRGYVLVSPYDVAREVTDGTGTYFTYGEIRLPPGKTPFLMSQDDLNYYGYMIGSQDGMNEIPGAPDTTGDGYAHKVVIGEDGYPTCEYMDANGNITTGDYDLVPVLETFIQEHPDFSYHGARAMLGITGYEGVFGYRTKPSYEEALGSERYQQEIAEAKKVAQCLEDHGWILASHSYGHPSYGNLTDDEVAADSSKWEDTVQPIIGNCDIILYPNGSDIADVEEYDFDNGKFDALYDHGYRYFFNVDSSIAWSQMGDNYFRGGRRNLDGYRMWYDSDELADLFDSVEVFDRVRPTPVPPMNPDYVPTPEDGLKFDR